MLDFCCLFCRKGIIQVQLAFKMIFYLILFLKEFVKDFEITLKLLVNFTQNLFVFSFKLFTELFGHTSYLSILGLISLI